MLVRDRHFKGLEEGDDELEDDSDGKDQQPRQLLAGARVAERLEEVPEEAPERLRVSIGYKVGLPRALRMRPLFQRVSRLHAPDESSF